jgi:cobalt transporter subunit CbtA
MFRTLVLSAAAAGVAAGLFTGAVQHVTTTPIIIAAEAYEGGAPAHDHSGLAMPGIVVTTHDPAAAETEEWGPADGIERTLYTSLATTVLGVGFGVALLSAMVLTGVRIDARSGLAFGVAGFAAFALAPALGLPPEIPGSGAAALADRQFWWAFAAAATAGGLALLLLSGRRVLQIAGAVLIALPHLVGAPHPDAFASTAPAELAGHFAAASLAVSALFWALLGSLSGGFHERFAQRG